MSTATTPVIVYSSTTCTYCKQLKTYLTDQNIAFEERNIDHNDAYREELQAMGMSSIPVTVIGDTRILGLNPTRIKKALAQ
ncbi:glutaredoxin family protein [Paenibacillus doosanensis]|uniref:Glutaredoxin-like protein NrdH n=1 Tax=Paenibacillus konkukensis TaxID=2020716 RepID=A0ABY4RPW6_9BACL|nr:MULTISPECIES: glutaredoxin family protein [Paenibacillus]MCS7463953.1 glutaredoxin family protein [Paenibacillus doosanensis]UQZ83831.1 Glutaredoxin-like protein NrdH [Paenibacillus konkukensis]